MVNEIDTLLKSFICHNLEYLCLHPEDRIDNDTRFAFFIYSVDCTINCNSDALKLASLRKLVLCQYGTILIKCITSVNI